VNHYVNFGAEYVYHCHILSHEEMDMMPAFTTGVTNITRPADTTTNPTVTYVDSVPRNPIGRTVYYRVQSLNGMGSDWSPTATIVTQ
jgi:hypothetical protein